VELRHTLRRYEVLNPSGVILTMADLAADCREGLAAIGEFGLPVALVSDGIHVPGSVRFASAEILAALERPSMAPEGSRPAGACQTVAQTGKAAAAA
jgi:flagellar biosynthesis GTPase FlhF